MDNEKTGRLIYSLRKEKGYTQKELADMMGLSDKTVSKWERGLGAPDISLLAELSEIFGIDTDTLLKGDLNTNENRSGNMKKIKFYVCPGCGNVITSISDKAAVSCCGKVLRPLEAEKGEIDIKRIDNEFYVSSQHEMTKNHSISFIAFVSGDTLIIKKQYPEWNVSTHLPYAHGTVYWHCSKHGLFYKYV